MPQTAANVRVGKPLTTGGVLRAALGTTLPADTTSALNAAFNAVGYISDDGVVQTIDTDSTNIKAWGGDTVRTVQTAHSVVYKFTMLETKTDVLGIYYGSANVSGSNVTVKAGDLDHGAWVLEIRDGTNKTRIAIPDGRVTDRGDIVFKDDEAVAYEVTVTAFPDASGVKAYIYNS